MIIDNISCSLDNGGIIKYSVYIWGLTEATIFLSMEELEDEVWRGIKDLSRRNLSGFKDLTLWLNSISLIHQRHALPRSTYFSIKSLSSLKLLTKCLRNLYPNVRSVLKVFYSLIKYETLNFKYVSSIQWPRRIIWYKAIITLLNLSDISLILLGINTPAWRFFPFKI